jgi:hypothetical protein
MWRLVVSFKPRLFYPEEITRGVHWIEVWLGPRTGLEAEAKKKKSLTLTGNRHRAYSP